MNELISKNITALQLFSENGLDPVLDKIKAEIEKFEADAETSKGRKEIASFARTIASSKVFIEKAGKELVSGMKAKAKLIDNERKRSRDTLDKWRDEVRQPLTDYENTEKIRVEEERQFEIYLMEWDEALEEDSIFNRERAIKAKEDAMAQQEEERRQKEESERLEKERVENEAKLKAEAEAKATRDAEAKITAEREANDKARKQAEYNAAEKIKWAKIQRITDLGLVLTGDGIQWVKDDINISVVEFQTLDDTDFDSLIIKVKGEIDRRVKEKAERDRIEAEELARVEKEAAIKKATADAEAKARSEKAAQDKLDAEVKAEADRKAANKRHQASVNNKILESMSCFGVDSETGKKLIIEIAQGRIPFLQINY